LTQKNNNPQNDIIIYNDCQTEDVKKAKIRIIEKVGVTLPFQLSEKTTKKDITWISEKFRGKVIESYCNHLKEGDIRVFTKRKILGIGAMSTSNFRKNSDIEDISLALNDNFLKVNGKEIY
jgi:hypothetical protein